MQCDELASSVLKAFNDISTVVFEKVYERWKLVLHLIVAGKGTNDLVEDHRGLKKDISNLPSVVADEDDEDEDQELQLARMMEEMDINDSPDREPDVDMEENMDGSDDDEECLDD